MGTEFVPATPEEIAEVLLVYREHGSDMILSRTECVLLTLASQVEERDRRIAELEGQLAARPVPVVPEPTGFSFVGSKKNLAQRTHDVLQGIEWARRHLHSVPPERVLGEGDERISTAERLALGECSMILRAYSKTHGIGVAAVERLDALRASKGGE